MDSTSIQMNTRTRILRTSLALFNREGVGRVPVHRIANELKISPGNVTYHFAKKQDIVHQLVQNLEAQIMIPLSWKRSSSAKDLARYLVTLFSTMWQYHFFFATDYHHRQAEPVLEDAYRRIRALARENARKRIEDAVITKDIVALVLPSSPEVLARTMWAVWIDRLGFGPDPRDPFPAAEEVVYECCLHHLSLLQPHGSPAFITRLNKEIRRQLGLDPVDKPFS